MSAEASTPGTVLPPKTTLPSSEGSPIKACKNVKPNYTLKYTLTLTGHALDLVKFSPNGKYLACIDHATDATIKIWEVEDGKLQKTLYGHKMDICWVTWSSDSKYLASCSKDKTVIIWNQYYGRPVKTLKGHIGEVESCGFNPQGDLVASGSSDGALKIWDTLSGFCLRTMPAHTTGVVSLDFNSKEDLLVTASFDGLVRIWDVRDHGHCLYTLVCQSVHDVEEPFPISFVQFSPSGKYILAGSLESTLKLFDYKASTCVKTYEGHKNVTCILSASVSLTGDETWLVSGSEDKLIYIWHMVTKEIVQILEGHTDIVYSVDCHPIRNMIASGAGDAIKVWESDI